jgi:hypothetical protein
MPVDPVITGGTVVTDSETFESDVAIDDGEIVGTPGHGRVVAREIPDWSV